MPVPHFREETEEVMNRDQFLDVLVSQENEQWGEVSVSVSQDVLDVPMPLYKEQLVEVQKNYF